MRLNNALVLRVAAMTVEGQGQLLTLRYHDEDAVSLSERFNFANPKERAAFNRTFARRVAQGRTPLELTLVEHELRLRGLLPVRLAKVRAGVLHFLHGLRPQHRAIHRRERVQHALVQRDRATMAEARDDDALACHAALSLARDERLELPRLGKLPIAARS